MALKKASDLSSGGFFNPSEHTSALAVLFEPKSIRKGVSNTFDGKTTLRDEVTSTVVVFRNENHLNGTETPDISEGITVHHTALASTLEKVLADKSAAVGVIRKASGKNYYALFDAEGSVMDAVEKWYGDREAKREAALADMPSLD